MKRQRTASLEVSATGTLPAPSYRTPPSLVISNGSGGEPSEEHKLINTVGCPVNDHLRLRHGYTAPKWASLKTLVAQVHCPPSIVSVADSRHSTHAPPAVSQDDSSNDCNGRCATTKPGSFPQQYCLATLPGFFAVDSQASIKSNAPPTICSRTLHLRLERAVAAARAYVGSVEPIHKDALLIAAFLPERCVNPLQSCPGTTTGGHRWVMAGLCVVKQINIAFRAHCQSAEASDRSQLPSLTISHATHVGDVWCTGAALCGIQLVWVTEQYQRRGVASLMIDEARRRVCYGYLIPRHHVAFSEPTVQGTALAQRYVGRDDFLLY